MGCGSSSVEESAIIHSKQIDEELKKYNKENIDSINKLVEERDLARKKKGFQKRR